MTASIVPPAFGKAPFAAVTALDADVKAEAAAEAALDADVATTASCVSSRLAYVDG